MTWTKTPADRAADAAFYQDPEYVRNKRMVRTRSGGRCEIQGEHCTNRATSCDHIIPRSQGGGHSMDNLRDACPPCHRSKTASEGGGWRKPADPPPLSTTAW